MPIPAPRPRVVQFAPLFVLIVVVLILSACTSNSDTAITPSPSVISTPTQSSSLSSSTPAPSNPLSQTLATNTPATRERTTITSVGSTALLPLVQEAAKQFMTTHPEIQIVVDKGGSGVGLTRVAAGEVNIGNSDIYADERAGIDAAALVDHKVCGQGFAIAVNADVSVASLTQQQAIDIFTGKITSWKDVGGADLKIQIISRPKGSGTRTTFDRIVLNNGERSGKLGEASGINLTEDSSATVAKAITDNPGAIGYLGLAYFSKNADIKKLNYNGVEASSDNIINGSYPIWSYGHMYTKGQPDAASKAFIDFILSDQFQNQTVAQFDYIPMSKLVSVKAP